jgi:hypothetical protein
MGESYDYSMLPTRYVSTGDKPGFNTQVAKKYPGLASDESLLEWLNQLSLEDHGDEVLKIKGLGLLERMADKAREANP